MKTINIFLGIVIFALLVAIFLVSPCQRKTKGLSTNYSLNSLITSKDVLTSLSDPNPFAGLTGC